MSQYPSEYPTAGYDQPRKPKKGWFGRNWLWFIPLVVLTPLLCCGGSCLGLISMGLGVLFDAAPYKDSIALAEQDPIVQQEIGTPIDAPDGFMDLIAVEEQGGEIDSDGASFYYAYVPITGPNGSGWLNIDATSNDGGLTWNYSIQQVELDNGTVIDLTTTSP